MTPPKSKMTCVYLDMARLERRLTLTSIGPRSPLFKARAPGTAPTRPLWDDDDPLLRVGLSREHFPIGGERRVAAATLIDRSQPRRNVHEGEPGLGDLLPERRSTPVGDAFLAAAGREKALPFGAGQPFDVGLRSEEHTSELQSLMRISYAVFCLQKKTANEGT